MLCLVDESCSKLIVNILDLSKLLKGHHKPTISTLIIFLPILINNFFIKELSFFEADGVSVEYG